MWLQPGVGRDEVLVGALAARRGLPAGHREDPVAMLLVAWVRCLDTNPVTGTVPAADLALIPDTAPATDTAPAPDSALTLDAALVSDAVPVPGVALAADTVPVLDTAPVTDDDGFAGWA